MSCFKFYERKKIPSDLLELDLENIGVEKFKPRKQSPPPSPPPKTSKKFNGKQKTKHVIEDLKRMTSPNMTSPKTRCKELINFEGFDCEKKTSILKSPSNDDLNERNLEGLCEWLISGFHKISQGEIAESRDHLLIEIQKNLRQLLTLRKRFEERNSSSTKDYKYDKFEPRRPSSSSSCMKAVESCRTFTKSSQNCKPEKSTNAADVIKNYDKTMKRISEDRNCRERFTKFKDTKKDDCEEFKSIKRKSAATHSDSENESFKNKSLRSIENRKSKIDDKLLISCKPTNRSRSKSSNQLISQSPASSDLRDVIKECKEVLKIPSKFEVYGVSKSPMVVDINCSQFLKKKRNRNKNFDSNGKEFSVNESENTWQELKKGFKDMDSFYECLKGKINNTSPRKSSANSNWNSSTFVQNLSDNNDNIETIDDNSLGLKLYSSIKQKFNHSINILTPMINNNNECCTTFDITNANNLNNAQKTKIVNTQQINTIENRYYQSIKNNFKQQPGDPLKAGTTAKSDWRSKIEYWDITSADVKEVPISTSESLCLSTPDQFISDVDCNNNRKVADKSQTCERVCGFFMGDASIHPYENRNPLKSDKESIQIVVNSNVNAGQRDMFNTSDICRRQHNKNKRTNNSNSIHNRPPWKPINTSRPPSRRKCPPPISTQNCFGMPSTVLPVTNDFYNNNIRPNYVTENDVSNNNCCCYCCQPDCCCQQLLLQLQFQQHCRYLEEMFEKKQEELKEELNKLKKCPSDKICSNPCANLCSNFTPNDNIIKDCLEKLKKNTKYSLELHRHNSFLGNTKNKNSKDCSGSWWVDLEKKDDERRRSKCSSPCEYEYDRNKFDYCLKKDNNSSKKGSVTTKYKDLFQKISSSSLSSCDKKSNGTKKKKSGSCRGNCSEKKNSSCSRSCQTEDRKKECSNFECQTGSKKSCNEEPSCNSRESCVKEPSCNSRKSCVEEPSCNSRKSCNEEPSCNSRKSCVEEPSCNSRKSCSEEPGKNSKKHSNEPGRNSKKSSDKPSRNDPSNDISIQTGATGIFRIGSCDVDFRKCMCQARGALLDQGPKIDKWERSNHCSCRSSQNPRDSQNDDYFMKCMLNFDACKNSSKYKDSNIKNVQSIINAFREKCRRSEKQFRDLKLICKEKQLIDSCTKDPTSTFNHSKICDDAKDDGDDDDSIDDCIKKLKKKSGDTRKTWNKDNRGDKADELVHCWIERCVKDKMKKNGKFVHSSETSCDDAMWDCQVMLDDSPESNSQSFSPNSKRDQKRNKIIDAIESYCREFGSTMPDKREGTLRRRGTLRETLKGTLGGSLGGNFGGSLGGKNFGGNFKETTKKKELFNELKKVCQSTAEEGDEKCAECRGKRKKVKLSFDKIRNEKKNKNPNGKKLPFRDDASTLSRKFAKSRSDSESSVQQIHNPKMNKNLVSFSKCIDKVDEVADSECNYCSDSEGGSDTNESFSGSQLKRKFDDPPERKKYRNRSHSNRYWSNRVTETYEDEDNDRSLSISLSRQSCPPNSRSSKVRVSSSSSDLPCSSRESLMSCLKHVLTKKRLERAIQEECLNFDIKKHLQLRKIAHFL